MRYIHPLCIDKPINFMTPFLKNSTEGFPFITLSIIEEKNDDL